VKIKAWVWGRSSGSRQEVPGEKKPIIRGGGGGGGGGGSSSSSSSNGIITKGL